MQVVMEVDAVKELMRSSTSHNHLLRDLQVLSHL
jgi:hypothetical protein